MHKLKPVLQHDEKDCGPACISMILNYYGTSIPLYKLRIKAGTDRQGTSGLGIWECASKSGLSCKTFVSRDKDDIKTLPVPSILHLHTKADDHYVVLEKVFKSKISVLDPAVGRRVLTEKELMEAWSGIFFVCMPEGNYREVRDDGPKLFKYLGLLKPYTYLVRHAIAASFVLSLFGIALSFYFRFLIDEVLYSEVKSMLNLCSLCYLAVILFQSVLSYCRDQILLHLSVKLDISLVCEFFYHLLKLPLSFFTARKTGEILSRIRDTETIRHTISSTTVSVVMDSIMIFIGGFFLVKTGSFLTLVAMIPILISSVVVWCSTGKFKRLIRECAFLEAEKNASMYETINGIATVKALSTEDHAFRRNEYRCVDSLERNMKFESFAHLNGAIQTFISSLGTLLIYWVGCYRIFEGQMTLGQLISFVTLSGYFLGPLSRLLTMQPHLQEAFVAADRLADIMELEEEVSVSESPAENPLEFKDEIKFDGVSFSYGTREKTIDSVSFSIRKGQNVAFVGKSGSGKSTLLKLLMKFYAPDEGFVFLDGKPASELNTERYRNLFGYVPQESLLFSGTVAENICWGLSGISEEQMVQAAKDAQAYDFIMSLPSKFMTVVGEQGATLSGGERQRLALARILLRNPEIIILDEATASLDSISEKAIMDVVNSMQDKTVIMVAHRLSTVRSCDTVFVMEDGHIAEFGSHDELEEKGGLYAALEKAQNE